MVDQNTDRTGWGMVALGVVAAAAIISKGATTEIGQLLIERITGLFTG